MYKSNWPSYTNKMIEDVVDILKTGKVNQWTGSKVFEFENKFSEFFGIKHSIAVSNGSVAIELCLKAINLQPGDEVIVTPRSFIASASSINLCNGIPIFIDVDVNSQNITLENIKQSVTNKTKAVILVHLAGWPCDLEEIITWCHSKKIFIIEDCAQAHGAKYKNKYVGSWGDINAWSFCQDKIISTGGEGGMVTTNNRDMFIKAWSYKDHGKNYDKMFNNKTENKVGFFKWIHDSIGTNWRMTEIQASIGINSLEHLTEWVSIRRDNASIFNEKFKNLPLIRLTIPDEKYFHVYYKYYCFINPEYLKEGSSRDNILIQLNNGGIPTSQGICGQIHKEMAYGSFIDLPITKKLNDTSLVFLIDPSYTKNIINEMTDKICLLLNNNTKNTV